MKLQFESDPFPSAAAPRVVPAAEPTMPSVEAPPPALRPTRLPAWAAHVRDIGAQADRVAPGAYEVRVTDPTTGGQKGQKPERYDLLPWDAMDEVARVYGFGATKYADDNWLKGYSWRLSLGALVRHVAAVMRGEDRDAESGLLHLAHAAWHCLTLITFYQRRLGTDDRKGPTLRRGFGER